MPRTVHLKIRLEQGQTIEALTAAGWERTSPPGMDSLDVEVARTFETDDAAVVRDLAIVEAGPFDVREARLKSPDRIFYRKDQTGGAKIGAPETLMDGFVNILSEVLSAGNNDHEAGPKTAVQPPAAGRDTPEPKPPAAPAPAPPAPHEVLAGVPKIPAEAWTAIKKADAEVAAKTLIEKAVVFETDRKGRAAWLPTRENALLAHLTNDDERADIARRLLEEAGGITAEHAAARRARNLMLLAAVDVSKSINQQLQRWTDLSKQVVPMLAVMSLISVVLIVSCLDLVRAGRMNGTELALLAFVFTLAAVSPATLLLIGRPLKGLDQWSPAGTKPDEAPPKGEDAAHKADTGGKPPASKSSVAPKAGS
jgi:hypothetical protein